MNSLIFESLPRCCQTCGYLDMDWNEFTDITAWYCELCIWWPWRKKTCKRYKRGWRVELKGVTGATTAANETYNHIAGAGKKGE